MTTYYKHRPTNPAQINCEHTIHIGDIALIVKKRLPFIILTTIIIAFLASLGIANITTHYEAQTLILFDSSANEKSSNLGLPISATSPIQKDVETLRSRSFAASIVDKLNLINDKEFSPRVSNIRLKNAQNDGASLQNEFKKLTVHGTKMKTLPPEAIDPNISRTVTRFLKKLEIDTLPGSIVSISFKSSNPRKAALIANVIAENYIEQKSEGDHNKHKERMQWLNTRITQTREEIYNSEKEIEEYKLSQTLEEQKNNEYSPEEIAQLNQSLLNAQSENLEITVQIKQLEEQNNLDTISASALKIIDAQNIKKLQTDKQENTLRLSELSKRYGPKHPEIIKAHAERKIIQSALDNALSTAKKTLKNEQKTILARIEEIQGKIGNISKEQSDNVDNLAQLKEKIRDTAALQVTLKNLLETKERTLAQKQTYGNETKILSYAHIPYNTGYPNHRLLIVLSIIVSFCIALALTFILEKLANISRTEDHLKASFGKPVYTSLPSLRAFIKQGKGDYILDHPTSIITEKLRALSIAITDHKEETFDHICKIITFTAPDNAEQKSLLSLWFARLNAKAGKSVLLIDANLRAPYIHKAIEQHNTHTLADALNGQKQINEIIQEDSKTNLDIIYGQSMPNSAFDLLSTQKMKDLIDKLGAQYDLIIFDTPPTKNAADAQIITKKSDHIIYVVNAEKTSNQQIEKDLQTLQNNKNSTFGFIRTNVKS